MRIPTAATLLLVLLAGTQARHFWQQDEPHQQTPLERAQQLSRSYLETLRAGFTKAIAEVDSSAIGQKLHLKLSEHIGTASEVVAKVYEELTQQLEPFHNKITADLENVQRELAAEMTKVQPFIDSFNKQSRAELEAFFSSLKPIAEEAHQVAQANLESVQQKIQPLAEKARDNMRNYVDELRTNMAPHAEELRQKMAEKLQELSEKKLAEWRQSQAEARQYLLSAQEKFTGLLEQVKPEVFAPMLESVKGHLLQVLGEAQKQLEQQQQQQ